MNRRIVLCVLFLILYFSSTGFARKLVLSPDDLKPTKESSAISRDFANTFIIFSQTEDGCIIGNTSIVVIRDRLNNDATTVSYESVKVDTCNFGEGIEDAFGVITIDPTEFTIDTKKFSTATLNTSITVFDLISGEDITVDINLVWTGQGDVWHFDTVSTLTRGNTYHEKDISTRDLRFAQLSGSVSDLLPEVFIGDGGAVIAHDESSQVIKTE